MGRNKAVGPDQIPIKAWRCLKDEGVKWLTCLFNKIFLSAKMLEEWRLSEVIPIYKNKGDEQACSNYRGIKLLSHSYRDKVKKGDEGVREPIRFYAGTAYDSVPRELVWRTLRDKGTPRRYSRVIKDMYEGVKTRVRTTMGNTEFFPVDVGLHQGSAISPYLFTLILDELSREIQESIPWCMIFADDIVLIAESAEELNNKIERWREALEDNGLRVSREKTEYLRCDFGRYEFGWMMEDVAHRIGVGWMKWRAASGYVVLGDHRKPKTNRVDSGGIENVEIREGRLRCFGHVKRRPQNAPVRRVEDMLVEGSKRRGRPKLRWEDRLKQDMMELLLSVDMTSDRNG
ncbi:probable LRR receptor-like serine/threonine-protein kinase RFK1 isoform X1 [Tanacetum coccineum]